MTDSPGQQCVREWGEKFSDRAMLDLVLDDEREVLIACIDALVRRERAGVIERLATEYGATAGHFLRKTEILRWLRARAAEEAGNE